MAIATEWQPPAAPCCPRPRPRPRRVSLERLGISVRPPGGSPQPSALSGLQATVEGARAECGFLCWFCVFLVGRGQ